MVYLQQGLSCHASPPPAHPRQSWSPPTTYLLPTLDSACGSSRRGHATPPLHRHSHYSPSLYKQKTLMLPLTSARGTSEGPCRASSLPAHTQPTRIRISQPSLFIIISSICYIILQSPTCTDPSIRLPSDTSPSRLHPAANVNLPPSPVTAGPTPSPFRPFAVSAGGARTFTFPAVQFSRALAASFTQLLSTTLAHAPSFFTLSLPILPNPLTSMNEQTPSAPCSLA